MDDDRQLVAGLRRGDADALRTIYLRHKDELLTLAACLLGDGQRAEDVLHDVFVALARAPGRRAIRRSLRGYLMTSVANRARDHLRRRARRSRPASRPVHPDGATTGDPADAVIAGAGARAVCAALDTLPRDQREVVVLHLHGGMTFRQIARTQGVVLDTARSRYRYGLDKLRAHLEQGAIA